MGRDCDAATAPRAGSIGPARQWPLRGDPIDGFAFDSRMESILVAGKQSTFAYIISQVLRYCAAKVRRVVVILLDRAGLAEDQPPHKPHQHPHLPHSCRIGRACKGSNERCSRGSFFAPHISQSPTSLVLSPSLQHHKTWLSTPPSPLRAFVSNPRPRAYASRYGVSD